jgi:GNAT superfamily N-acetyltransferase
MFNSGGGSPLVDRRTKSTCAVRAPEPGDYNRMADLAGQLGYPCRGEEIGMRLAEMQDPNQYAVYVAQLSGGQIAGWIGVYIFRAVELDSCAEISGLIVDQLIRSRGIGKVLLDAAEEWARRRGCNVISVLSNVTRDRAHGFYRKNGYERNKTEEYLRKSL